MRSIIKNLAKLDKRLTTADFVAKPAGVFLREWREDLKDEALSRAPVGATGRIVRALQSQQDTARFPLYARVFSEAPEARWSEYGTGVLSEDPQSAKRPYFPPVEGVREWSAYHSLDPYIVALGIFERGGTKPTHFFSEAERAADASFAQKMMRFGREIEYKAGREP